MFHDVVQTFIVAVLNVREGLTRNTQDGQLLKRKGLRSYLSCCFTQWY